MHWSSRLSFGRMAIFPVLHFQSMSIRGLSMAQCLLRGPYQYCKLFFVEIFHFFLVNSILIFLVVCVLLLLRQWWMGWLPWLLFGMSVIRGSSSLSWVNFVSLNFAEIVYELQKFPGGVFRVSCEKTHHLLLVWIFFIALSCLTALAKIANIIYWSRVHRGDSLVVFLWKFFGILFHLS